MKANVEFSNGEFAAEETKNSNDSKFTISKTSKTIRNNTKRLTADWRI